MSLNPSDYEWTIDVHEYEPVPTLDPMVPEELLKFTSCNYHEDCSNRRCNCWKNGVTCISACGVCKGITCRNCSHHYVESEEGIDNDLKFLTLWIWNNSEYYMRMWNKSYFVCKCKSECDLKGVFVVKYKCYQSTQNHEKPWFDLS